jgi:hypothetical protein
MPDFRRKPKLLMAPKVLVIDFRPAAVPAAWNHSTDLIPKYIAAMRQASADTLVYRVVNTVAVTTYPHLLDGRQYTDETWALAHADDKQAYRDAHGNYMLADYQRILQDFNILPQVKSRQIDEVWLFGGPYFGFYESRMVGRGAFWCNGPGIEQNCRRFVVMGYNYERDVKEMVHDFGHRTESILARQFGSAPFLQQLYAQQTANLTPKNAFEQFLLTHGTVHRQPGGADYSQDEMAWVSALLPAWFPPAVNPGLVP